MTIYILMRSEKCNFLVHISTFLDEELQRELYDNNIMLFHIVFFLNALNVAKSRLGLVIIIGQKFGPIALGYPERRA